MAGSRLTPCLVHLAKKKERKYRNKPEFSDLANRRFDSAGERRRGEELLALQKAGAIRNLRYQVRYDLTVNGIKVCGYIADFVYEVHVGMAAIPTVGQGLRDEVYVEKWKDVVEDYKGYETPEFRIKQKLFRAVMGFDITVIRPVRKNFKRKG